MGDRTGGREPKLSSLKKSKKNPGAPAGRVKKVAKSAPTSSSSLAAPPPSRDGIYFDCAVAFLSRQFDRDRDRVVTRAQQDNLCGMIAWFSDVEKQSTLSDICKANTGFCYFVTGVHPDNIERTNKKNHDQWIEKVEELARKPECVGILSGLNLSRDIGTHFAQESLLRSSCTVSDKLLLPLIIHCPNSISLERAVEIMKEENFISDGTNNNHDGNNNDDDDNDGNDNTHNHRRVIIHDPVTASGCDPTKLTSAIACGLAFLVSAVGLTDDDATVRQKAKECIQIIPRTHLLSCTDSPWRTPQNIPDQYLRTLRNEPCNIVFVNAAIADALDIKNRSSSNSNGTEVEQFSKLLRNNAFEVFGFNVMGSNDNSHENQEVGAQSHHTSSTVASNVTIECKDHDITQSLSALTLSNPVTIIPSNNQDNNESSSSSSSSDSIDLIHSYMSTTTATAPIASSYYGCIKCRAQLFPETLVSKHGLDTSKAVFKVGEEGLCSTVVFVPCTGRNELMKKTLLSIKGGGGEGGVGSTNNNNINSNSSVECSICGCKLGKFHVDIAHCACGATVKGPTVRLLTSKMDYFDLTLDQKELVQRAKLEVDDVLLHNNSNNGHHEDGEDHSNNKKSIKKNLKVPVRLGGGNFSNFRNKSFIPNASRSQQAAAATAAANLVSGKKGGSGSHNNANDDDEDEEEEEEEEDEDEKNKDESSEEEDDDDDNNDDDDDGKDTTTSKDHVHSSNNTRNNPPPKQKKPAITTSTAATKNTKTVFRHNQNDDDDDDDDEES